MLNACIAATLFNPVLEMLLCTLIPTVQFELLLESAEGRFRDDSGASNIHTPDPMNDCQSIAIAMDDRLEMGYRCEKFATIYVSSSCKMPIGGAYRDDQARRNNSGLLQDVLSCPQRTPGRRR